MANAKRLMSVVLILAMLVTMASFPVSAADASQINPISVTSPFTAGGSYNIFGVIDGSEAADPNYFRADKYITSTGSKGNDANFNVVVDLGGYYNLTKIYTAFGAQFATGVALWGSNDNATWTELDDLTLSAQRSTTEVSHEGFYRYIKVEAYKTKDNNPAILEITFYGDSDPLYCKVEGLNGSNVVSTGASQRYPSLNQNLDTLFDGDASRTNGNGIQYNWTSQATKKTIEVTLNDVVDVAILKLYWGNMDNNAVPAQTYNVYLAGEDGVYGESVYDYTDSATKQDGKSRNDAIFFDTLAESVKKIKIEITDHYKTGDPAIREIEIVEKLDENEVAWADYTVNYVDTEGNPVFESKVVTKKIAGREVTETAEELAGYRLEVNSQTVTLVEGMNTITFTYVKLPSYTVKYVDENGNPIASEKIDYAAYGDVITEKAIDVSGYMYVGTSLTKDLTLEENGNDVIIFDEYVAIPKNESGRMELTGGNVTFSPTSQRYGSGSANPNDTDSLFDGDTSNTNGNGLQWNWTSSAALKTVEITLDEVSDINSMKIYWGCKDWNALPVQTYSIYFAGSDGVYGDAEYIYTDNATSQNGKTRDDTITFDTAVEYVKKIKIEITAHYTTGDPAIREIEINGAKAVTSTNSAIVTVNYVDEQNRTIAETEVFADDLGNTITIVPTNVDGYKYVGTDDLDIELTERAKNYVVDLVHRAIPNVIELPAEDDFVSIDPTNVPFEFKVTTPENVNPEDIFVATNWVVDNCTITSVEVVVVDDPNTFVYEWKVVVNVVPANNDGFSLTLDLPDEYELTDSITFNREATGTLLDSAIAEGENVIILGKTSLNIEYNADGTIKSSVPDRTVSATVKVQTVNENALPYKNFDDVVIKVTDFVANGEKVRFDFEEDFVRVGDEYYGSFTFSKAGVERFQATVAIIGVNADGTTVVLDEATVYSEILNITESFPVEQTDAEKVKDQTFAPDILDQLIGQVHPYDLPIISEGEWEFYKEVLKARGVKNVEGQKDADKIVKALKDAIAAELASVEDPAWVASDYPDDIIVTNHRITGIATAEPLTLKYETVIRVGYSAWNALKDLHVDSFSLKGSMNNPSDTQRAEETLIEDFFVTFRNGIDYDYTNWLSGNFAIRMKHIGQSAEYANVDLRKGYNAVRRALNDDQVNPIMFRLDWYNWPSASSPNPFTGGIITVQVTEDWIDNNGMFNLATYRMAGYSYKDDNDPELTLMQDKVSVSNYINRYVSVEIEGDKEMYDSYVIVGTDKLPSELPETIGTYFEVE